MIKYASTYLANCYRARILIWVLTTFGPKVSPDRVGVSRDEHNHVLALAPGYPTHALSSLRGPFSNIIIIFYTDRQIYNMEVAVAALFEVLGQQFLHDGEMGNAGGGAEPEVH